MAAWTMTLQNLVSRMDPNMWSDGSKLKPNMKRSFLVKGDFIQSRKLAARTLGDHVGALVHRTI
jgi:hypothetical protein